MKLLIIRHADPDYVNDTLTDIGWQEAKALADRMKTVKADKCYVSPLNRAKDTARLCLDAMGMEATELEWLREFAPVVTRPENKGIAWDWLPADWTNMPYAFDQDRWTEHPALIEAGVKEEVDWVYREFDSLLADHGYKKDGKLFRAIRPNNDTIVIFCHFGLECVLLSYLLNLPLFVLWHSMIAAPSSVTTVVTEERRSGIAQFRMPSYGDISHLYAAGMKPSFAGRFRECYTNEYERLD